METEINLKIMGAACAFCLAMILLVNYALTS